MREIFRRQAIGAVAADAAGQIGRALGLDGLDRTATTGALDDADDGQAEIMRHLFRHQGFCRDRSVRRTAADRKVVADHDYSTAVDLAAAEHAVRRRYVLELALLVIFADA